MHVRRAAKLVAVMVGVGVFFGSAPSVLAWGSSSYLNTICTRLWGSENVDFGGSGANRARFGNQYRYAYMKIHGYLKYDGAQRNYVVASQAAAGVVAKKAHNGGVTGSRRWTVDAYGWESANSSANQLIRHCVIT
uniref:hypothetical protein n=1 Tax=Herbidospora sakaeratensis TaxID=564415 RepID=UPI00078617AB|nr:hypothetical protein [Herbidospora sakaeratensis]